MFKGALALFIRYCLYAIGAGLTGFGAATMSLDGFCLNFQETSRFAVDAITMMVGGGSVFAASAVWSRIVKAAGGAT